jgi:peptidoglycan hydrolase-like protein with peptidoglycan-binding domain
VTSAAATPGAFLLRYPPAPGEMGHIAVSDGAGGTIEAASKNTGVVAGKVSGRRWDVGVLVPGIDYSAGAAQAVAPPAKIYAVGQPNMNAEKVRAIQSALTEVGFSPGQVDGEYGQNTALAVAAFQHARGLITDGEVGPDTANALGVTL